MRKSVKLRKIIVILVFSIFVISLVRQGIVVKRIKDDIKAKTKQLEELKEKNIKLQAELESAQTDNDYLERLARERLGLIKKDEQQISSENN